MTELVRPAPGDRILEIGTGSGYQAAVLAALVSEVLSIGSWWRSSRGRRQSGSGSSGPRTSRSAGGGGRMVIPVGDTLSVQTSRVVEKSEDGEVGVTDIASVRFVPLRRDP